MKVRAVANGKLFGGSTVSTDEKWSPGPEDLGALHGEETQAVLGPGAVTNYSGGSRKLKGEKGSIREIWPQKWAESLKSRGKI